jgi:RNA polymerase sigma-70 factor (ECF subfamily)
MSCGEIAVIEVRLTGQSMALESRIFSTAVSRDVEWFGMPASENLSDEELVQMCRKAREPGRRRDLLGLLFERYEGRVALWCLRFSGNREDGADLAQEVFLRVSERIDSFHGRCKFSTWLYTVVRNHCLNFQEKNRRRQAQLGTDSLAELADPHSGQALKAIETESSYRFLIKLMQQTLNERERTVMVLHFGQGIQLAAITRLLSLENASGAKAYVVSARRKLDAALKRHRAEQERWKRQRRNGKEVENG